jgi:hypothetical protein
MLQAASGRPREGAQLWSQTQRTDLMRAGPEQVGVGQRAARLARAQAMSPRRRATSKSLAGGTSSWMSRLRRSPLFGPTWATVRGSRKSAFAVALDSQVRHDPSNPTSIGQPRRWPRQSRLDDAVPETPFEMRPASVARARVAVARVRISYAKHRGPFPRQFSWEVLPARFTASWVPRRDRPHELSVLYRRGRQQRLGPVLWCRGEPLVGCPRQIGLVRRSSMGLPRAEGVAMR